MSRNRAYEEVVERCQRSVYTYAFYFLGDRESVEDLTQEVFLKLWRHWGEIDLDRVEAWLIRVTRNACYDALRQRRTVRRHVAGVPEGVLESRPDEGPGPGERAEATDVRRLFRGALRELREPLRSAIILREVLGLKYQEVADALEIPLNTVRVYLYRGRRRLREELKGAYAGER
jgi:RNA polymerase sigma-70 factor (ECF subfamily)